MIKTVKEEISPLEILPKEFFESKKFGNHYYKRAIEDIDQIESKYIMVCDKSSMYKEIGIRKYTEDIVMAMSFLENTEYLELVMVKPTNDEEMSILLRDNHLERGTVTSQTFTRKLQVGHSETKRFDEVLSKEISDQFVKLGDENFSNRFGHTEIPEQPDHRLHTAPDVFPFVYKFDKDTFFDIINDMSYIMESYLKFSPNTLLIPKKIFDLLTIISHDNFDEHIDTNIITRTYININGLDIWVNGLDIWVNPHSDTVILYHNPYMGTEPDYHTTKSGVGFFPYMLFGKRTNDPSPNRLIDHDKYHHKYLVNRFGFFPEINFMSIYFNTDDHIKELESDTYPSIQDQ